MSTIVVSNFTTGFETDLEPINISNDAFPVLQNAFIERGKVRRKRGSEFLGRLRRALVNQSLGNSTAVTWTDNIFTLLAFTGEDDAALVPGTLSFDLGGVETVTDGGNGILTGDNGATGTINYASGAFTINHSNGVVAVTIDFSYFPALPVLGLEDFENTASAPPELVAFDNKYSYEWDNGASIFYDVTFYKQTAAPFTFTGNDYNQFWSLSYEYAMFVCNGTPGLHGITISSVSYAAGVLTVNTTAPHGLTAMSDYVYINEIQGTTIKGINGFSGLVQTTPAPTRFTLNIPGATVTAPTPNTGFVQYLTRSNPVNNRGGGIKFYTGDPITSSTNGWVNFAPPLSNLETGELEYLAGAKTIIAFKDRLLFFNIFTMKSDGTLISHPARMAYSQNGTPYYANVNFTIPGTNVAVSVSNDAWFQNVVAKGGFLDSSAQEEINITEPIEDNIVVGQQASFRKLVSTGDDAFPFYYQTIDSEFGGEATFASINLDKGALVVGNYGFILASPDYSRRFDEKVPDIIFDVSDTNNNEKRTTGWRDYRFKSVYFTFLSKGTPLSTFPNLTLYYNYQERHFGLFNENATHYGYFRESQSLTWATLPYDTWSDWTDPWNFGGFTGRYPTVIFGNQQGFVLKKVIGTTEDFSQQITAISGSTITSPNHCMNQNDYIVIDNIISTTEVEKNTYQIIQILTEDTFVVDQPIVAGTYRGGGTYYRIPKPIIRTKMFNAFWGEQRKTRLGPSYFLMGSTGNGEVIVNLYTDQNIAVPVNQPQPGVNDYMPFTQVLLTKREPGITSNINPDYQMHKLGTSVIGDSFQVEITLNDSQMREPSIAEADVVLHAMALKVNRGPIL